MDKTLEKQLTDKNKWIRVIFMVVYAIVGYIVQFVIWALAVVQLIFSLFAGAPNSNLLRFTDGLTLFAYHIMRYLTYNTEEKPYPFNPWPHKNEETA